MTRTITASPFIGARISKRTVPISSCPILADPFLRKIIFLHRAIVCWANILDIIERAGRQADRVLKRREWSAIFEWIIAPAAITSRCCDRLAARRLFASSAGVGRHVTGVAVLGFGIPPGPAVRTRLDMRADLRLRPSKARLRRYRGGKLYTL